MAYCFECGNEEVKRTLALENQAEDYDTACKIRALIAAVESADPQDEDTLEWIRWAKEKADWYDPTISAEDTFLGKRDHSADHETKKPKPKGWYW